VTQKSVQAAIQERAAILQVFFRYITDNCLTYAPADSSDRMKTAIYQFFMQKFKINKFDPKAQGIVLGRENVQAFVDSINMAKEKYKLQVVEPLGEVREKKEVPLWNLPVIISYNSRYKREDKSMSIMKPFYTKKTSEPERLFIELLGKFKESKMVVQEWRKRDKVFCSFEN
jgi:hypothetical protein